MKIRKEIFFSLGIGSAALTGLILLLAGIFTYAKVTSFFALDHWLSVFQNRPYSNGDKPVVEDWFYTYGILAGTNMVMTGIFVTTLVWKGLRNQRKWCWWLIAFAIIWVGSNDSWVLSSLQASEGEFSFWLLLPFFLGLSGLGLTAPSIFGSRSADAWDHSWNRIPLSPIRERVFQIGTIATAIGFFFPIVMGSYLYYTVLRDLSDSSGARKNGDVLISAFGHLGSANLIMTGVGSVVITLFGIRRGLAWCWWLLFVVVFWAGLNDTVITVWLYLKIRGIFPYPLFLLFLGMISLVSTFGGCFRRRA